MSCVYECPLLHVAWLNILQVFCSCVNGLHRTQVSQNDKRCVRIFLMSSDHGPRTRATSEKGESFCYAEVGTNYPGVKFMQACRCIAVMSPDV